jgi:alanine racemase
VAAVSEGADLRDAGIAAPLLLFSQALPEEIPGILRYGLQPFVSDGEFIGALAEAAGAAGRRLPVHLKIDTGMGRLGCAPEEAPALAAKISAFPSLEYAGTATHLAVSDSPAEGDRAYTGEQIRRFGAALDAIRAAGLDPGIVHAANSGAVIHYPSAWFDMVRPGILLYGYDPGGKAVWSGDNGGAAALLADVKPVMELRSRVSFLRSIKAGTPVSYGRIWTSPRDTIIAVIPAGYADGLPRLLSGKDWHVHIRGRSYPLAGRICMDQCMADLGPDTDIERWEEVSIFGGETRTAADLAERIGTIPYEITCNINKRVPREYLP